MGRKDSASDSEDVATDKAGNSSDEESVHNFEQEISSNSSKNNDIKVSTFPEPSIWHAPSGIHFRLGARLEAKDMGNDIWYPVKVMDLDTSDMEVLIHFEKWSQRYDEWVSVDSSRLRQTQQSATPSQHSAPERKKKKKANVRDFSEDEKVMATWTDTRKYGAVIKKVLPEDKYEVLFLDGYKKVLKGSKISKLVEGQFENAYELKPPRGLPKTTPTVPPKSLLGPSSEVLCSKEERRERKRKINVAELFHPNKRQRMSPLQTKAGRRKLEEAIVSRREEPRKREEAGKLRREEPTKRREEAAGKPRGEEPRKRNEAGSSKSRGEEGTKGRRDEAGRGRREETKKRDEVGKTRKEEPKKREEAGKLPRREEASKAPVEEVKRSVRRSKLREEEPKKLPESKPPASRGYGKKHHRKGSQDTSTSSKSHAGTSKAEREVGKGKKDSGPADGEEGVRWEPEGEAAWIVDSTEGPRKSIIVQDLRLPKKWTKHTIQRRGGGSAGKWDVFLVSPAGRKFRSRNELRSFFEDSGEPFPTEMFDFSLGKRKYVRVQDNLTPPSKPSVSTKGSKIPSPAEVSSQEQVPVRRVKTLLPKVRLQQASERAAASPPPPHSTSMAPGTLPHLMEENQVLIGRLKIEIENNMYKCPKETCGKMFRKENLLQMHLKHYHPEYNSLRGVTPNVADLAYARTIADSLQGASSPRPAKSTPLPFPPKTDPAEKKKQSRKLTKSVPVDGEVSQPGDVREEKAAPGVDLGPSPLPDTAPPEKREHQTTIKTLLPVRRSPYPQHPEQETDRIKSKLHKETVDEGVNIPDVVGAKHHAPLATSLTKPQRCIRKRHLPDYQMEPFYKKRRLVRMDPVDDAELMDDASSSQDGSSYRYGKKKGIIANLDKLNVATDSNDGVEESKSPLDLDKLKVEQLRKEEIINCTCGFPEEDGLMIQCDLCLCWQHGVCNKIEKESDVPDKYVCYICLHPNKQRMSKKFLHDQDWLKEGKLPSLSFRSKDEASVAQREAILKKSHELTGSLVQIRQVVQSLRVKMHIAGRKPDHPKLYLWAKNWDKTDTAAEPRPEPDKLELEATQERQQNKLLNGDIRPGDRLVEEISNQLRHDPDIKEEDTEVKSILGPDKPADGGTPVVQPAEEDAQSPQSKESASPLKTMKLEMDSESHSTSEGDSRWPDEGALKFSEVKCEGTLLQQALTNGLDPLQLPICQSELMRFARTMAVNLAASEPPAPHIPQPETPIDPLNCRIALLDHIDNYQQHLDSRLTSIEAQIAALESQDPDLARDEAADFYPRTKQTVQMLLRDLVTMRRIAAHNN